MVLLRGVKLQGFFSKSARLAGVKLRGLLVSLQVLGLSRAEETSLRPIFLVYVLEFRALVLVVLRGSAHML